MLLSKHLLFAGLFTCVTSAQTTTSSASTVRPTCIVPASGTNLTDDAPAVLQAFKTCGHGGNIVFSNTTYYINSPMNVSGINDCAINITGTLLWSTDTNYWLKVSMPIGYQNQSTAFILSGNNIRMDGNGYGTFDGNGNYWYARKLGSNYPGRPHQITFANITNSVVSNLLFFRSQMWTMDIIHASNITFDSIYVNNLGTAGTKSSNTDGADTLFSSNIRFNNWTVVNGDDSISLKANSTDVSITNSNFYQGLGIAFGSIGQYLNVFETIERISGSNNYFHGTTHAIYFKTWTGDQVSYPPNGGGGGLGYITDLNFTNLHIDGATRTPFTISQCTTFNGAKNINCTNSKFQIRNVAISRVTGTIATDTVASFQCSAVEPCTNISMTSIALTGNSGTVVNSLGLAAGYLCGNVVNLMGGQCNGLPCVSGSSTGGC